MKRVLVTGAAGFIGANLVRRLLADGHKIAVLTRPGANAWRLNDLACEFEFDLHQVNLCNADDVRRVVRQFHPEWIFHCAAHGAYSWQTDWVQIFSTNLMSTITLLECCAETGFEAFINAGSSSEYGFNSHSPKEEDIAEPNSYYAISKLSATMACNLMARSRELNVKTLRLYSVFGPWEDQRRLIPTLIKHGLMRSLPALVNPEVCRDFVYIDDVVDAFLRAANQKQASTSPVYNVGSGVETSIDELVEHFRQRFDITELPRWKSMQNRKWDTISWVADATLIHDDLSWTPRVSLEQGIESFITWCLSNPAYLAHANCIS